MLTCRARDDVREATLASFGRSDWRDDIQIFIDESRQPITQRRIEETFLRMLRAAAEGPSEFTLMMEDDIEPNQHLRHNLERWAPLLAAGRGERPFFGSLYRCCQPVLWRNAKGRFLVGVPEAYWGGQAVVLSRATAQHALGRWVMGLCAHDAQLPLLAAEIAPIYYHLPSLVQHRTVPSTWGNGEHRAADYDPAFRIA